MTTAQSGPRSRPIPRLWGIVLAGGQGTRLAPLVARIHRDGRPKQYAVLLGSRSLLRQTLDRVALAVPSERTIVVATNSHSAFLAREFAGCDAPKILVQPAGPRDRRGDPAARPLDRPAGSEGDRRDLSLGSLHRRRRSLRGATSRSLSRAAARLSPSRILLVGVRPDSPESGYGWIEPGANLGGGLRTVRRFWEKPDPETARACMDRGCVLEHLRHRRHGLRHSRGVAASPSPDSTPPWEGVGRTFGPTRGGARNRAGLFGGGTGELLGEHSRDASLAILAVSTLPELSWSDWGTPERVFRPGSSQGVVPAGCNPRRRAPESEPDRGERFAHESITTHPDRRAREPGLRGRARCVRRQLLPATRARRRLLRVPPRARRWSTCGAAFGTRRPASRGKRTPWSWCTRRPRAWRR